jgi:ClpP class serine protease
MEKAGFKAEFISAGRYKTEGNSLGPLDPDARVHLQAQVDTYYQAFTQAVARGRSVPVNAVRGGMGQGRCLLAGDALKAGMINGIDTFDGVVNRLGQKIRQSGAVPTTNRNGQSGMGTSIGTKAAHRERELAITAAGVPAGATGTAQTAAARRQREIELAALK